MGTSNSHYIVGMRALGFGGIFLLLLCALNACVRKRERKGYHTIEIKQASTVWCDRCLLVIPKSEQ